MAHPSTRACVARPHARSGVAGFTLIEVLGAAVILAIALGSILAVEVTSLYANRRSRALQNAAGVAADEMEAVHKENPSALPPTTTYPPVTVENIAYTPTVAVAALSSTMYEITVSVAWQDEASFVNGANTTHSIFLQLFKSSMESF